MKRYTSIEVMIATSMDLRVKSEVETFFDMNYFLKTSVRDQRIRNRIRYSIKFGNERRRESLKEDIRLEIVHG